jgi:hypothetical protein
MKPIVNLLFEHFYEEQCVLVLSMIETRREYSLTYLMNIDAFFLNYRNDFDHRNNRHQNRVNFDRYIDCFDIEIDSFVNNDHFEPDRIEQMLMQSQTIDFLFANRE